MIWHTFGHNRGWKLMVIFDLVFAQFKSCWLVSMIPTSNGSLVSAASVTYCYNLSCVQLKGTVGGNKSTSQCSGSVPFFVPDPDAVPNPGIRTFD
jgi:hypothetical protein